MKRYNSKCNWWAICDKNGLVVVDYITSRAEIYSARKDARIAASGVANILDEKVHIEKILVDDLIGH